MSVLITSPAGGIQFVQNATSDYDYGSLPSLPDGFGDGEFTFKIVVYPYQVSTIGSTDTASPDTGKRENWSNDASTRYSTSEWWYRGNFLLDGFNNNARPDGTFAIQIYNSGRVRWHFGDDDASIPTGGTWAPQGSTSILSSQNHVIHCVRRWQSSPANSADLELWVDGVLEDTENSGSRTDVAAGFWDSGFTAGPTDPPANQRFWCFGAELQAAVGDISDYEDFKGIIREVAFYDGALSAVDIGNDQGTVDTGHANYLDHFGFAEGAGNPVSNNGITMTLNNAQGGGFWP